MVVPAAGIIPPDKKDTCFQSVFCYQVSFILYGIMRLVIAKIQKNIVHIQFCVENRTGGIA
jgi:hypothetical protein